MTGPIRANLDQFWDFDSGNAGQGRELPGHHIARRRPALVTLVTLNGLFMKSLMGNLYREIWENGG